MRVLRPHKTTILLSDEELAMLRSLAESQGLTVSDWIRTRARKAYEESTKKEARCKPLSKDVRQVEMFDEVTCD